MIYLLLVASSALLNSGVVVGWHDFPIHPHDRPPDHQTVWLSRQIDLLSYTCMKKFQPIYSNIKETIYHYSQMKINCLQICSRLYTIPWDGIRTKYSLAPCGSVLLYTPYSTPVTYAWIIRVNQQYRINSTFVQLDMIYNDPLCQYSYVQLLDYVHKHRLAKLCGRSHMKVFYSEAFSVNLTAKIVHLNKTLSQILHYEYQIYSRSSVSDIVVRVEDSEAPPLYNRIVMSALLRRIRIKTVSLRYQILHQIIMTYLPVNCTWTRQMVYVYDGPDSRSFTMATINQSIYHLPVNLTST